MFISRMYCVTKNPAMLITGSFYRIRKNMFMLTFSKPPAFRITGTAFLCFHTLWDFFWFRKWGSSSTSSTS